ncbi:MAG: hypothetical protein HY562_13115 [Ignavibacteriales bacterium]|nr:hypothetical protein [Ignavibacteriales bacterium]
MASKSTESVQAAIKDRLMKIKGVVGVSVGELQGKQCIKVTVDHRTRKLVKQLPKTLDGFVIVIEETGEFITRQRTPPY